MRYIVYFEDPPEMAAVRAQWSTAHLAFLDANSPEILIAGGLRHDHGDAFQGGLWVLNVVNRERAQMLVEADPYFMHGNRKFRIHAWGKAFEDRVVVL